MLRYNLKGLRVQLLPPASSDFPLLVKWRNESRKFFFDGRPVTPESTNRWFTNLLKRPGERFYVIQVGQQPVGTVSLSDVLSIHGCAEYGHFLIASEFRRRGHGREALYLLLDFAFGELGLHRVYGDILSSNEAAFRLNRSLGFRSEGLFQQSVRQGDWYVDVVRMAILAHEFEAIRPVLEEQLERDRVDRDGDAGV